jgi:hypothetical protein
MGGNIVKMPPENDAGRICGKSPDSNSDFAGWSGDCTGVTACVAILNGARSVTVNFAKIIRGDMNGDGAATLADAITALKAICGLKPGGIRADDVISGTDVDGDGKIGLADVIYILQALGQVR